MSVREYKTGRSPLLGQSNNALVMLIAINALVFIVLIFLKIVYSLSYSDALTSDIIFHKQVLDWFTLPAGGSRLLTRPWTLLVYMFTNYRIWALISSLLWLWAFGYILQDLSGNKRIFPVYLYGGFAGAVFFLLSVNFIPSFNTGTAAALMGGGPGVMAIAVATTTLAPDYRLFPLISGGIPLWVLTLLFVILDYAGIADMGGGYAVAHLAGGVMGFIFVRQLRKGQDWGEWMNSAVDWVNNLLNPEKKQRPQLHKEKVFYQSAQSPYQKKVNITQQRLDELLDKIHDEGYHMLTEEEKDFLKQASKEEL